MHKIDTHVHTPYFSGCANMPAEEIVQRYKTAGYDAVTITDHYNLYGFSQFGVDPDAPGDKLHAFLEGYRRVKAAAEPLGLRVYYGAEVRFTECFNDYLVYGFSDELLSDPKKVCSMGIRNFISLAREDGALVIQAHPFRNGCLAVAPLFLDGAEVANRHPGHQNRNELALDYASRYGLRMTGGSDFHDYNSVCAGGILADTLPEDSKALARLLRGGNFKIL